MKAEFTVTYEHDGNTNNLSCKSGKSTGEVLFLFHKHMQVNKGISHDDYKVIKVRRGSFGVGYTVDEEQIQITPDVRSAGGTSTKFE